MEDCDGTMTDDTARKLAEAMLKLAEAINGLTAKFPGLVGASFTVYHQHQNAPSQPRGEWGGYP